MVCDGCEENSVLMKYVHAVKARSICGRIEGDVIGTTAHAPLLYIIAVPRDYVVPKERNPHAQRGRDREKEGYRPPKKKTSVALVYKKTPRRNPQQSKININKKGLVKIIV